MADGRQPATRMAANPAASYPAPLYAGQIPVVIAAPPAVVYAPPAAASAYVPHIPQAGNIHNFYVEGNKAGLEAAGRQEYRAPAFSNVEDPAWSRGQAAPLPKKLIKRTELNLVPSLFLTLYLSTLAYYIFVRISRTLGTGYHLWYGSYLLGVEIAGASTVLLYAINLLWSVVPEPAAHKPGKLLVPYHIRVLVPCYKEPLDIVRRTVLAAAEAHLPAGCQRTIYLCDDGKDPRKREWCDSMGPDVVYVSGRQRPSGEMNGKSGNLNNCCSQLYPRGIEIPDNELICVFDADQVAKKEFFLTTVPLFDGGEDVGMVLSPQFFFNCNPHCDMFNHSNLHFWEYHQPGYDALGFISCTGTNFLVRAKAFQQVGGSPTYTLTEDFALGMEMKKCGWQCRYVQEYLAVGEAPSGVRNCFQQRSRWTKGHFQIFFNVLHCPLLSWRLPLLHKMLYCSGVWSYVVAAVSTPTFILVPLVNIWGGYFPIIVSRQLAVALTLHTVATHLLLYYVRKFSHLEALWFANIGSQLFWWTYVKAWWRGMLSVCGSRIQFKVTAKGKGKLANSAIGDLWLPALSFLTLAISVALALYKVKAFSDINALFVVVSSPLAVSILWALYAMIPPYLLLHYAVFGKGFTLQFMCQLLMLASFLAGAGAVGLMWRIQGFEQFQYSGLLPLKFGNFVVPTVGGQRMV